MGSAHSFIGTSAKGWRRVNSLKLARTWQRSRRIMRRWALRLLRARVKRKDTAMSSEKKASHADAMRAVAQNSPATFLAFCKLFCGCATYAQLALLDRPHEDL